MIPLSLKTAAENTTAANGTLEELRNDNQRAIDTGSIKACGWDKEVMNP